MSHRKRIDTEVLKELAMALDKDQIYYSLEVNKNRPNLLDDIQDRLRRTLVRKRRG